MKMCKFFTYLLGLSVLGVSLAYGADKANKKTEFPGRDKYKDVKVIELEDLFAQRNDVIIVDARSSYEYETLRVKGALNISLSSKNFGEEVARLRATSDKPIVFYCNGKTCFKSYKAVRKAMFHNIDNVMSFDAGIFDWAKSYPNEAVLLGETPINPKHLIAKSTFKKKLLDPAEFGRTVGPGTIVVDVRDLQQREAIGFFPGYERRVGLDDKKKLMKFIKKAKDQKKTLLIYDAVGKQVRWLMYTIERAGLKKYWFMKGGAKGYYEMLAKSD